MSRLNFTPDWPSVYLRLSREFSHQGTNTRFWRGPDAPWGSWTCSRHRTCPIPENKRNISENVCSSNFRHHQVLLCQKIEHNLEKIISRTVLNSSWGARVLLLLLTYLDGTVLRGRGQPEGAIRSKGQVCHWLEVICQVQQEFACQHRQKSF